MNKNKQTYKTETIKQEENLSAKEKYNIILKLYKGSIKCISFAQ